MGLKPRKKFKYDKESPSIIAHIHNRNQIWESQNGRKTEIKDMDINHIKNCIAKIKREDNWRENYLNVLEMEEIYRQVFNNELTHTEWKI